MVDDYLFDYFFVRVFRQLELGGKVRSNIPQETIWNGSINTTDVFSGLLFSFVVRDIYCLIAGVTDLSCELISSTPVH